MYRDNRDKISRARARFRPLVMIVRSLAGTPARTFSRPVVAVLIAIYLLSLLVKKHIPRELPFRPFDVLDYIENPILSLLLF